jgi:hypothetical protein
MDKYRKANSNIFATSAANARNNLPYSEASFKANKLIA